MVKKRKAIKSPEKRLAEALNEIRSVRFQEFLDEIVPNYTKRLADAEEKRYNAERHLKEMEDRLIRLLTKDQLEAATICGCPPEIYAIEFMEIFKEKKHPDFSATFHDLTTLRNS